MLPPLVSVEEFQARYPDYDDDTQALTSLEDASAEVRAFTGLDWVDDDGNLEQVPDIVQVIVMRAARRDYDNPDNYRSEQIGQYAYQTATTSSDGGLLTESDKKQLVRAVGQDVHSIRAVRDSVAGTTTWWLPSSTGGDLIPWEEL